MMLRILVLSLLLAGWAGSWATAADTDNKPTEQQKTTASEKLNAAVAAAQSWLEIVDSGKYTESWKKTALIFQNKVPQDQWDTTLHLVRSPLGKLVSRELSGMQYATNIPAAPMGHYAIIQFKTVFKDKQGSVETVTLMLEPDEVWRVAGYFIK